MRTPTASEFFALRWRSASGTAGSSSLWAMAEAPATRSTSQSNSGSSCNIDPCAVGSGARLTGRGGRHLMIFGMCPAPILDHKEIVLGHGSGGRLSQQLIETIVLPAFRNDLLDAQHDGAIFSA